LKQQNSYSHQLSISPVALALLGAFVIVAASMLAACQPIQPVPTTPEPAGVVMAAETAATPEGEDSTNAEGDATEVASVADDAAVEESQPDPALVEAGMAVYRAQYCGICHTLTTAGTTGTFGPPHDGLAETAALRIQDPRYAGEATTPEQYIAESIVKPQVYTVEGYVGTSHAMPPYTHLSDEDVQALVALLMSGG